MTLKTAFGIACVALATSAVSFAQANDDCGGAIALVQATPTPFDTTLSTPSIEAWTCAGTGQNDLWYSFTPATTAGYFVESCGSGYDTALTVFDGACGSTVEIACNDDSCGLQSRIDWAGTAGTTYLIRIGGFNAAVGTGDLLVDLVPAPANDDCLNATPVTNGAVTAFSNLNSTASGTAFTCGTGGSDVWFSFTPVATGDFDIGTCGSTLDTVMELYTGACGSLVSAGCSDDDCGTGSQLTQVTLTGGTTYTIRVSGAAGAEGDGVLLVTPFVAPPAANCARTLFGSNNGGAAGGAVYFDMTLSSAISIAGLDCNYAAPGAAVGMEIWTHPGTSVGNEVGGTWTMVGMDDGTAISAGEDNPTTITWAAPVNLPAGTFGVALVSVGAGHEYTNGNGANQVATSTDGVITLNLGTASNAPFTGGIFTPRVWNGEICHGAGVVGTPFCNPNDPNSTGMSTNLVANFGTGVGSDLHLDSNQGPSGQFGYFLVGTASSEPGIMLPNSQGRLCLAVGGGASIGRYNVSGSGFNSLGSFNAAGELQNLSGTSTTGAGFDVPVTVPISGSPMIMTGSTWHFQLWHRENAGLSNFSNGLSVTF